LNESSFEYAIRSLLRDRLSSASHSIDHLDRVLSYALSLRETYGGDIDVITAAALLHDLGRNDKGLHGAVSAQRSADDALAILAQVGFPETIIPAVQQAIAEHDQPSLRPTTLEGRILKDADFLAGFGATGIARAALWTGESGGTMDDLKHRLETKMAARIASLEFEQSRYQATQDYLFVRLFLEQVESDAPMLPLPPAPYVVIEGISGSGKSTQAEMLATRYAQEGYEPVRVHEPTAWFKEMRNNLDARQRDRQTQLLLLLTDRYINVRFPIQDAQNESQPVISDRSYLSSMVYQGGSGWVSPANIAYLHTLVTQPTHLFLLDLPAEDALERIEARLERGGTRGDHETLEQLTVHRERYQALSEYFPQMVTIDASQPEDAIHEFIWNAVSSWSSGGSAR
jgi:dTMP kinase